MELNSWWRARFESLDSVIVALENGEDAWAVATELAKGARDALSRNVARDVAQNALGHFVEAMKWSEKKNLDRFKQSVYGARVEFNE